MARADRNGKRKSRDSFKKRVPDLGYYFVVTDTNETEENYMYGLRDSLPKEYQGRVVIKVSKAKTDELVSSCKEQAALEPQYGEPWIVFDRDRVVRFDEIIKQARREGVHVGWSNPCIEIWFDAYFGKIHSYQDSVTCCREFGATFERKTGQEYQKATRQIYDLLNRYGMNPKQSESRKTGSGSIAEMDSANLLKCAPAQPSSIWWMKLKRKPQAEKAAHYHVRLGGLNANI